MKIIPKNGRIIHLWQIFNFFFSLLRIPYLLNIFLWTRTYVILSFVNISLWKVFHFVKAKSFAESFNFTLLLFFFHSIPSPFHMFYFLECRKRKGTKKSLIKEDFSPGIIPRYIKKVEKKKTWGLFANSNEFN